MKYEEMNVGLLIEQRMNDLGMSKAELARKIGIPNQNVNRLLEKKNMNTARLASIGEALDYDFFSHFRPKCTVNDNDHSITAIKSAVSVGGNATNNIGANTGNTTNSTESIETLYQRIELLQQLLEEKERTIKILMERK